jgi:hypothetical protein
MTEIEPDQKQRCIEALRPFAAIGQWLFARDLPDDTPQIVIEGINGMRGYLTRGDFKRAHLALRELESAAAVLPSMNRFHGASGP